MALLHIVDRFLNPCDQKSRGELFDIVVAKVWIVSESLSQLVQSISAPERLPTRLFTAATCGSISVRDFLRLQQLTARKLISASRSVRRSDSAVELTTVEISLFRFYIVRVASAAFARVSSVSMLV